MALTSISEAYSPLLSSINPSSPTSFILEKTLEPSNDTNYIYRILTTDVDGSYLEEEVFSSIESSFRILKNNQKIVKENIINLNTFKYVIEDVL